LDKDSGEIIDLKCRPTLQGLHGQLDTINRYFPGCTLSLCYEAT